MAKQANMSLKKIEALKKRLQKLPLKEDVKSREEAAQILETSFQNALKKGYTLKELRALFVEEGVALPLSLLKRRTPQEQEHSFRNSAAEVAVKAMRTETKSSAEFTGKPDRPDKAL